MTPRTPDTYDGPTSLGTTMRSYMAAQFGDDDDDIED